MKTTHRPLRDSSSLPGFTLIEMLISVSLVLLMMVMFAEIFSLASSSMTQQQAIADNDQQVRSFTTVLREDFHKRTMRSLIPFDPQENTDLQTTPYSEREGYFYLSLNDPDNSIDNVLQFTVRSTIKLQSGDESPYYGKATGLVSLNPPPGSLNQARQHVQGNSQQPEHDDGELELNATGASPAAEICYFVRGGRLYRRVSLLREPLPVSGGSRTQPRMTWDNVGGARLAEPSEYFRLNPKTGPTPPPLQTNPATGEYGVYDSAGGARLSNDYWNDFDYSARRALFVDAMGNVLPDGAEVVLARDLDNSLPGSVGLGNPRNRFGFDQFTGISREFSHADPAALNFFFIGRYTLEEMSHTGFNFPQADSILGPNPLSYASVPALVDVLPAFEPDGVVDDFTGGDRRGEDLLLSNVHAFDIEVWDDRIGDFAPLGHDKSNGGIPGDFNRVRYQLTTNGEVVVPGDQLQWIANAPQWLGRTFDTWHPVYDHDGDNEDINSNGVLDAGEDADSDGVLDRNYDRPPYRPLIYYSPNSPIGPYASRGFWQPSTAMAPATYAVGDIVFPRDETPTDFSFYYRCVAPGTSQQTEDRNGNGVLDPAEDVNGNGMLDPGEDTDMDGMLDPAEDQNMNGRLDTFEPAWALHHGGTVEPTVPTEPRWQAFQNVRPLRAIRIQVRFLHVASGKMRQLTLVHSLID
jgi:type II secretory pathway pseudopilin PulG